MSKCFRSNSSVWEDYIESAVDDNLEVDPILEESPVNIEVMLNNSDGFLFSLPLETTEQSINTLAKKGKPGRKANFTPEEDTQLAELVKTHGETKWSFIASIMKKWNRKQLRERYINFIKGKSSAVNFSPTEDAIILEHIKNHGHTWKNLASKLPGRSPIAIKNRYYKVFLKKTPELAVINKDIKNDIVSDRVSTKCNSLNEKLSEDGFILEDKLKVLLQQEERFIQGIEKIKEKLSQLQDSS